MLSLKPTLLCLSLIVSPLFSADSSCSLETCSPLGFPIEERHEQCFLSRINVDSGTSSSLDDTRKSTTQNKLLSSFLENPTEGQHLMLVSKSSPYKLVLDANVANRLSQQLYFEDDLEKTNISPPTTQRQISRELEEFILSTVELNKTNHQRQRQRVPLLLESGKAIVTLSERPLVADFMMLDQVFYFDLGIGDAQDALEIWLQDASTFNVMGLQIPERRYLLERSDGLLFVDSSNFVEGSPVLWSVHDTKLHGVRHDVLLVERCLDRRSHFSVNEDGTISPIDASELVIGISPYPQVTLVPSDSESRFLFEFTDRCGWCASNVSLTLKSHPGMAIVATPGPYTVQNLMSMQELGLGPSDQALGLFLQSKNGGFLLKNNSSEYEGATLTPFNLGPKLGNAVRLMSYVKENSWVAGILSSIILSGKDSVIWIINEEGSLSPLDAPDLALGCDFEATTPNIDVPGDVRSLHMVLSFSGLPYLFSVVVLLGIWIIQRVPYWSWSALVIWAFFGPSAIALFVMGTQVGAPAMKTILRRLEKRRQQEPRE